MKLGNILKAWKSTVLAVLLVLLLAVGVWFGKIEPELIAVILPVILALIPSDVLSENKPQE